MKIKLDRSSRKVVEFLVLLSCTTFPLVASAQDDNEYRGHLAWSRNDTGARDCDQQYLALNLPGAAPANRAALMIVAGQAAARGQCAVAFQYALITQCHNAQAQAAIHRAGSKKVCDWFNGT